MIKKRKLFPVNILTIFAPKISSFNRQSIQSTLQELFLTCQKILLFNQFIKINSGNKRIYLGLLNSSFTKGFIITKNNIIGFLLCDSKDKFTIKHETTK